MLSTFQPLDQSRSVVRGPFSQNKRRLEFSDSLAPEIPTKPHLNQLFLSSNLYKPAKTLLHKSDSF